MNEQIREIAHRLYGLRDALGLSVAELAKVSHVSEADYLAFESGASDIPIGVLQAVSKHCGTELTALLFGEEPTVTGYYLTRAGLGTAMERTKAYKYQALASGFAQRKADPFIVTVEPKPEDTPLHLNSHDGQEFNYVLEGTLLLCIDGKELVLNEGDSLYFDASKPHGMKALHDKPVRFIAIIF
ncbi:MAG TPA: transcriptional regulator [Bacteroidales bacterium]|nr:transcriptional regulator [Bacteroidales bacterium]